MEVVLKFFQGFINMGASTLLPFVIAILGIFFGMKIRAFVVQRLCSYIRHAGNGMVAGSKKAG